MVVDVILVHFFWLVFWAAWLGLFVKDRFGDGAATVSLMATHQSRFQLFYMILLIFFTLFLGNLTYLHNPFFRSDIITALYGRKILGIIFSLAGLGFTVWSRITLGQNWTSGGYYLKSGHRLVDTGPYALARHPIYTGVFSLLAGTCLLLANPVFTIWSAIVYYPILGYRARLEEQELEKIFGEEYSEYRRRVSRFFPGFRR